jgi:hypothetical protein
MTPLKRVGFKKQGEIRKTSPPRELLASRFLNTISTFLQRISLV